MRQRGILFDRRMDEAGEWAVLKRGKEEKAMGCRREERNKENKWYALARVTVREIRSVKRVRSDGCLG